MKIITFYTVLIMSLFTCHLALCFGPTELTGTGSLFLQEPTTMAINCDGKKLDINAYTCSKMNKEQLHGVGLLLIAAQFELYVNENNSIFLTTLQDYFRAVIHEYRLEKFLKE